MEKDTQMRPARKLPRFYLRQRPDNQVWEIRWFEAQRPHTHSTGSKDPLEAEAALDAFMAKRHHDAHHQNVAPLVAKTAPERTAYLLWRRAKERARQRGLRFEIVPSEVASLLSMAGGRCSITGVPFDYEKLGKHMRRPWAPSLDRREPTKGYTFSNCRVVCVAANLAMNTWGEGVFRHMLEAYQEWRQYRTQLLAQSRQARGVT